jgi:hypothetical protein
MCSSVGMNPGSYSQHEEPRADVSQPSLGIGAEAKTTVNPWCQNQQSLNLLAASYQLPIGWGRARLMGQGQRSPNCRSVPALQGHLTAAVPGALRPLWSSMDAPSPSLPGGPALTVSYLRLESFPPLSQGFHAYTNLIMCLQFWVLEVFHFHSHAWLLQGVKHSESAHVSSLKCSSQETSGILLSHCMKHNGQCVNNQNFQSSLKLHLPDKSFSLLYSFFLNFIMIYSLYRRRFRMTILIRFILYISYIAPHHLSSSAPSPSHLEQLQEVSLFYFI